MLDYYSEFEQPCVESRIKVIKENVQNPGVKDTTYEKILRDVCENSPTYSYTGWAIFGKKEEERLVKERLSTLLENKTAFDKLVHNMYVARMAFRKWFTSASRPPGHNGPSDKGGHLYNLYHRNYLSK